MGGGVGWTRGAMSLRAGLAMLLMLPLSRPRMLRRFAETDKVTADVRSSEFYPLGKDQRESTMVLMVLYHSPTR